MKAFSLRVAVVVAGLALAAGPVLAQSPKAGGDPGGGGGRGGGGGGASSGGGPAGGGGGNIAGSVSSGGGGGDVSSGGSSFSSPSVGSIGPSSSFGSHGGMQMAAPVHRTSVSYSADGAGQRTHAPQNNSPSSGERAVPRASAPSNGSSASASGGNRANSSPRNGDSPRNDSSTTGRSPRVAAGESIRNTAAGVTSNNASGANEVPSWSRSRGDRPVTGTAVPRSPNNPPPDRNHGRYGYYDPYYYDPYGVYGYYGYGGGYYGFYDPFYYPYGFGGYGLDPGFGFPYYADPSSPYDYGEGYGSYSSRIYSGRGQGALKLKVKPRDAKVYVDGYYVGNVDQFDGAFQKLSLNSGSHKVEVKAEGYETAEFDVLITQDKTLTFAGDLKKLQ